MNEKNIFIARILTYMGTIPFLFLGMAVAFQVKDFDYNLALVAYGAVIISFLSGIHWAVFLFFSQKCSRNLLLHSNFITLVGWLTVLPVWPRLAFSLQILLFIYLLIIDFELYRSKIIPLWFFKLRFNATLIVVSLLVTIQILGISFIG